jgi:hypothetical protein
MEFAEMLSRVDPAEVERNLINDAIFVDRREVGIYFSWKNVSELRHSGLLNFTFPVGRTGGGGRSTVLVPHHGRSSTA